MSEQFDPYYEWLGIPARDQPANHYRLLGIEVFEENLNVIERAADRQMGHLRTFQNGQRAADSQRLLNELSAAKVTLLRADKKAEYDATLRAQIQAEIAPAADTILPVPMAQPVTPAAAPAPATVGISPDQESASVNVSRRRLSKGHRHRSPRLVAFAITFVVVVAVGLIAAVYTGVFSSKKSPSPVPSGEQPIVQTTKQPSTLPATQSAASPPPQPPSEPTTESTTVAPSAAASTLAKVDESRRAVPDMHPAAIDSSLKRTLPSDWTRSIEAAEGIVTDRFLLCQSMPYDEFLPLVRPMFTFGCRPLRIRPYSVGGVVRVAAVWTRDERPWRFVAGVTASEYTAANESLTSAGFEPVDVAGFGDDEVRFAGVWVKSKGAAPECEVWLGRTPSEFRDDLESRTNSRLICHTRHLFLSGDEHRYSVIWKPSPPGATQADRFGGSRSFFEARLQPGDHLLDISVAASEQSGLVLDAALVRGLPSTTHLYSLTPEKHLERSRELARQGLSPASICVAWLRSGQPVVASVWEPSPNAETASPANAAGSYALHFDGRSSVVLSGTRGLFDLDKQFTAEVWFRITKPPASNLTACLGTGAGKALHPEVTGPPMAGWLLSVGPLSVAKPEDTVQIRWSDAIPRVVGIHNTVPALNDDWHHLAICNQPQDNGGWVAEVFLDGKARMKIRRPASDIHPSPVDFFLGVSEFVSAQTSFYGDMRACRLSSSIRYTSQFSPDETFAPDESTLALLQFDGADPSVIKDVSGANRHGQIHGATWINTPTPSAPTPSETPPNSPPPRPNLGTLVAEAAPGPRLAVPSADERRAASEKVKEIYADDFAKAKEPAAMVALANDLSQQAVKTQDGAAKFGLLFEARQLAIDAVNPRLALRMTDHLVDAFEVKSWTLKADTMTRLSDVAKSPTERQVLAELVLDKSEEALLDREFEAADKLNGLIAQLNRPRDRDLAKASLTLKARIAEASEAWRRVEKAKLQLEESPDDPQAHLTVGRYLCFVAADWDNGLPHLARGEHAALKDLATQDLADPSESQAQLKMADAWYDWGQKASGSDRSGAWLRSQYWYDAALPDLTDLDLAKAIKRLSEIADEVASKTIRNAKFPWLDVKVGLVKTLEGHTSEVRSLAVAHTGNHIVSGSTDQTVRFWDIAKGEEIALLRPGVGTFARLGLSPDDKFVIVAGTSEIVEIWNLQSGKLADRLDTKLRSRAMATARDSNVLLWALSSSRPANLRLFALRQGQIGQLNCPGSPLSIAISDNGRLAAAGSSDGNVYVWRLRPAQTAGPFTGLGSSPSDVALSADGTMVAACVFQQTIVWDINTGNIVSRMPTSASCYRIAFSPDGSRLLTVGQANEISVWNVEDGRMIETLSARNSNFIGVATAVDYLPDPRGAVSAGTDGVIRVWRLPD